jgi:hypothetical protein
MQAQLQRSDNAEVASTSAQTPQEVGVLVLGCGDQLPVRGHEIRGHEVVAGQAVHAVEPPQPTAQGQPRDTGHRDHGGRRRQTERLRFAVQIRERCPGLHGRDPARRIDPHGVHRRQVERHAPVAHRSAGHAVTPPLTESGRPWARANVSPWTMSSRLALRTIAAGRRSIIALKTLRA